MRELQGPILVLGAGGFIGSSVFKALSSQRADVFGTITEKHLSWRLGKAKNVISIDLLHHIEALLTSVAPKTIINCVAYGSFPQEKEVHRIYRTNFDLVYRALHRMDKDCVFVNAGTSSEYGFDAAGPKEFYKLSPNSDYAVSKAAASQFIEYAGKQLKYKCANLRLYSVYGPYEAISRLMPQVVAAGDNSKLPKFVAPYISRDFVYIDDVVEAFVNVAKEVTYNDAAKGESYNICTSVCTTIAELALLSRQIFGITDDPEYSMPPRSWDFIGDWYGDNKKVSAIWKPKTALREGIMKMWDWYKTQDSAAYELYTKK